MHPWITLSILAISALASAAGPFNLTIVALSTTRKSQLDRAGGCFQIMVSPDCSGAVSQITVPDAGTCVTVPGQQSFYIGTDCQDYDVSIRQDADCGQSVVFPTRPGPGCYLVDGYQSWQSSYVIEHPTAMYATHTNPNFGNVLIISLAAAFPPFIVVSLVFMVYMIRLYISDRK